MKHLFLTAALTVALCVSSALDVSGGVILISTRKNICRDQGADDLDAKGPGMTTPGDVGMQILLGDHGYSSRLVLDVLLGLEPDSYFVQADTNLTIDLVIWSGSSSSADVPAPPAGIPLMMGEHVTLGNNEARAGSIFMYNGTASSDPNDGNGAS